MAKRGRFSTEDMKYIREQIQIGTPTANIAKILDRELDAVNHYVLTKLGQAPTQDISPAKVSEAVAAKALRESPDWNNLKDELTEEELLLFESKFARFMAQFEDNVLATEESQIFILIKYEILMSRNMKDCRRSIQDIDRLEKFLAKTYRDFPDTASMDDKTKNFVQNMETQLLAARAARQSKSTEYVKLTEKHTSLMQELKATRNQRISKVENSKVSFLDLLRSLQDEEFKNREGRHAELLKHAREAQKKKLGELHQYCDGTLDRPLLTAETLEEQDQ